MNPAKFTASVCTLSWIDQRTKLPENDADGPLGVIPGYKVTREDDTLPFRFLNLLEATILVDGSSPPRILSSNWTSASRIYQNPSYGKIKSEAFQTRQSIIPKGDRVVFQQTVGARTVSPEVIAEMVGGAAGFVTGVGLPIGDKLGRAVSHEFFGFPPIWTTLTLTLFSDGRSEGAVLCHSLFPSMSYYALKGASGGAPRETSFYSLVGKAYDVHAPGDVERWKTDGWGPLPSAPSGPSKGNPWGLKKSDLTVRPVDSGSRTV